MEDGITSIQDKHILGPRRNFAIEIMPLPTTETTMDYPNLERYVEMALEAKTKEQMLLVIALTIEDASILPEVTQEASAYVASKTTYKISKIAS